MDQGAAFYQAWAETAKRLEAHGVYDTFTVHHFGSTELDRATRNCRSFYLTLDQAEILRAALADQQG